MKKSVFVIICMLLVFTTCACEKKEKQLYDDAPFAHENWFYLDASTGSNDEISFKENNAFSYVSYSKEPVLNLNLYDKYGYDKEDSSITLYNDNNSKKIIKVLSYNSVHLLLQIDDIIRDFSTIKTNNDSKFFLRDAKSYLSGYALSRTITEITQNKIMTAAINYDKETNYPKNTFEEFKLAKDVVYFDLNVISELKVVNGIENEVNYDVSYKKISSSDINDYLEQGAVSAYMWLNDDMQINKIVVFGMRTVIK